MEWLLDPQAWIALFTLTALEIVLGVDNIIFISILVGRLPERSGSGRACWVSASRCSTRIVLLLSLAWVMTLTEPLFSIPVMGRTLGPRSDTDRRRALPAVEERARDSRLARRRGGRRRHATRLPRARASPPSSSRSAIIDIVFSLDSVITAVGMVDQVAIMVLAIVIAVVVMMFAARPIGEFVDRHPTVKMLALSFLILVGRGARSRRAGISTSRRATSISRWRSRSASRCSISACAPATGKRSGCARAAPHSP